MNLVQGFDFANLRKGFVQLLYVDVYCSLLWGFGQAATVGLNDLGSCKASARAGLWWRRRRQLVQVPRCSSLNGRRASAIIIATHL